MTHKQTRQTTDEDSVSLNALSAGKEGRQLATAKAPNAPVANPTKAATEPAMDAVMP